MRRFIFVFAAVLLLTTVDVVAQSKCENIFLSTKEKKFLANQSWGQQIFEREFDKIGQFFIENKELPDHKKIDEFRKSDMRKALFRLQSLSRMLTFQNSNFFSNYQIVFKRWEDAAGRMDLSRSLRKISKNLGHQKLIEHFQSRESIDYQKFIDIMKQSGFWDKPEETVNLLKSTFSENGNWSKGEVEKKYFIRAISDYTLDLQKDIERNKFDNENIEKGLHKIRRRLRWILFQVISLDGVVVLANDSMVDNRTSEVKDVDSKYTKMKKPLVANPILVPLKEMTMIADLVTQIGETKDQAEIQIHIQEALLEMKSSESEIDKTLHKLNEILNTTPVDHQEKARQIQKELAKNKLLKNFVDFLNRERL